MIWNNKKYIAKPLLVKEDSAIQKHRRWFSQFYSKNSPRLQYQRDTLDFWPHWTTGGEGSREDVRSGLTLIRGVQRDTRIHLYLSHMIYCKKQKKGLMEHSIHAWIGGPPKKKSSSTWPKPVCVLSEAGVAHPSNCINVPMHINTVIQLINGLWHRKCMNKPYAYYKKDLLPDWACLRFRFKQI